MKRLWILLFVFFYFLFSHHAFAQEIVPHQLFEKAKVTAVLREGSQTIQGVKNPFQDLKVQVMDGEDKGKELMIKSGYQTTLTPAQLVKAGDTVVLSKIVSPDRTMYVIYDTYRLPSLFYLLVAFIVIVICLAGWKGVGSIFGLTVSLLIITLFIVPQILSGKDPLTVSIIGSLVILLITTYLAHGVSRQTTVALFSTFISLMITAWLASFFVNIAHLSGFTEETAALQFGMTKLVNVKGLLLGGIIIGTLGALNDVTTTQSASVFELSATDHRLGFSTLYKKGFSIGREHVVSLVNTLVLAYAGSSLALFLFLVLNPQKIPIWVIINSEDISDEIIRTLAGSLGLILVVPIVTCIAAAVCDKKIREKVGDILLALR